MRACVWPTKKHGLQVIGSASRKGQFTATRGETGEQIEEASQRTLPPATSDTAACPVRVGRAPSASISVHDRVARSNLQIPSFERALEPCPPIASAAVEETKLSEWPHRAEGTSPSPPTLASLAAAAAAAAVSARAPPCPFLAFDPFPGFPPLLVSGEMDFWRLREVAPSLLVGGVLAGRLTLLLSGPTSTTSLTSRPAASSLAASAWSAALSAIAVENAPDSAPKLPIRCGGTRGDRRVRVMHGRSSGRDGAAEGDTVHDAAATGRTAAGVRCGEQASQPASQ